MIYIYCNCSFSLLFYNIPKYWIVLKMSKCDINVPEENRSLHFLKTPKLFFPPSLPLTTTILPLSSVSLSPFYSPCPNPLFMSLPLHLCGYMTHHTRLPFGFSVSFIPSLVSPSFFFSFSLFPAHTAVTYFIVMFHAPSWPPLHILISDLVGNH